jgi:hypothetical protein
MVQLPCRLQDEMVDANGTETSSCALRSDQPCPSSVAPCEPWKRDSTRPFCCDRPSILCGPTLDSRSFCAVLASRDEGKDPAVMDANSCIEPAPKGQHEVCVTQDHIGRPIIFRRIRETATRTANYCARFYRNMTSGRFPLVQTTAIFRTHDRPCKRECATEYGEYKTQNYRLVINVHASSSGRP